MIPDREIWVAASVMVKRYGDDAMLEAAARADQLLEEDPLAAATLHRILNAIAGAPRAHSLGDQERQSLTVEILAGRFLLARFPQFLAVSFD